MGGTARDPDLTCDAGKYNQMRHLVGASNHCLLPINKQLCNNLINYLPESNTERQIRRCC